MRVLVTGGAIDCHLVHLIRDRILSSCLSLSLTRGTERFSASIDPSQGAPRLTDCWPSSWREELGFPIPKDQAFTIYLLPVDLLKPDGSPVSTGFFLVHCAWKFEPECGNCCDLTHDISCSGSLTSLFVSIIGP